MHLIEVVVEGIPGTHGVLKYPLESGLNAWKQKGTVRLETIVALIESLLYPASDSGAPLGPGRAKMAGVTFNAGGTVYRLIRDYSGKSLKFSQLQAGSKNQFRDLSTDSRFITTTLTRAAKLPSRRVFRSLLVSRPGIVSHEKETHREKEPVHQNGGDPRQRLSILKREKEGIETIRTLETENDGLQNRVFEIEDQLRRLDEPQRQVEQVRNDYEPFRVFDTPDLVTPQILKRLKNYPGLADKRVSDLQALEEKIQEWDAELTLIPVRPFWQEVPAYAGVGFAVLCFISASFLRNWKGLLLLAATAGLGVFVWGIFQGLKREERAAGLRKTLRGMEGEKAGIEKRFEIETAMVKKFCDAVKINDTKEIEDMLSRWETMKTELKRAEEEFDRVSKEIPQESLRQELAGVRSKLKDVEGKLRETPNASVDPVAMDREIRDLEATLANPSATIAEEPPRDMGEENEVQRLLTHASEFLDRPVVDILGQAASAISANLATLTAKRIAKIEVRGNEILGFRQADGNLLSWGAADPQTQSTLLFGIQFTLWQMMPPERALPVVVDLNQSPVSEATQKLMLAAAQYLAKKSQVLALLS